MVDGLRAPPREKPSAKPRAGPVQELLKRWREFQPNLCFSPACTSPRRKTQREAGSCIEIRRSRLSNEIPIEDLDVSPQDRAQTTDKVVVQPSDTMVVQQLVQPSETGKSREC